MPHGLIIATSYDVASRITHSWAAALPQALTQAGLGTWVFLSGAQVTRSNMQHQLSSADYVVFYGHGELDRLWAQPTGFLVIQQNVLIDPTNVAVLQGRPIYVVCCRALHTLGAAYAHQYPQGAFVGYAAPFGVSRRHAVQFGAIANTAAVAFVGHRSGVRAEAQLKHEWTQLAASFLNPQGSQSGSRNAFMAGYLASMNAAFVGCRP